VITAVGTGAAPTSATTKIPLGRYDTGPHTATNRPDS